MREDILLLCITAEQWAENSLFWSMRLPDAPSLEVGLIYQFYSFYGFSVSCVSPHGDGLYRGHCGAGCLPVPHSVSSWY